MLGIELHSKYKPKPLKEFGFLQDEMVVYGLFDAQADSNGAVMAVEGGYMDQPQWYHHAMGIMATLYAEEYEKLDRWLESQKPANQRRQRPQLPPNFK